MSAATVTCAVVGGVVALTALFGFFVPLLCDVLYELREWVEERIGL